MAQFSSTNQPAKRGRPKGTITKHAHLRKELAENEVELTDKLIKGALDGDPTCMKIAFERMIGPVKPEYKLTRFKLPEGLSVTEQTQYLIMAVSKGEISIDAAATLLNAISNVMRTQEADLIKTKLQELEQQLEQLRNVRVVA